MFIGGLVLRHHLCACVRLCINSSGSVMGYVIVLILLLLCIKIINPEKFGSSLQPPCLSVFKQHTESLPAGL